MPPTTTTCIISRASTTIALHQNLKIMLFPLDISSLEKQSPDRMQSQLPYRWLQCRAKKKAPFYSLLPDQNPLLGFTVVS